MIKKISIRILSVIAGLFTAWLIGVELAWLMAESSINVDIVSGILFILIVLGVLLFVKNKVIKYYFLIPFILLCLCYAYVTLNFSTISD